MQGRRLSGAAAAVLLACALAACQVPSRPPPAATRAPTLTARDQGVTASALARGRWSRLPAAPIPDRDDPVGVWTGRDLLVWGGHSGPHGAVVHGDGAAYDPARGSWRRLPPAPLAARAGATAVWTGREVLSVTGSPYGGPMLDQNPGARYDPARNRWRRLADGPLDTAALPAGLWTGAALLVWNGTSARSGGSRPAYQPGDGAAWDPRADRWVRLPRSPLGGSGSVAVWTGRAALVWGGRPWPTPVTHTGMVFTPAGS